MRRSRLLASFALGSLLVLGAAGCGDDDDDTATATTAAGGEETTTTAADDGGGGAALEISGFAFPEDFTVEAGAEVEVVNNDSAAHTVTADDDAFDSGDVEGGANGSFTAPDEPGEFTYHCERHPDMTATLVVT